MNNGGSLSISGGILVAMAAKEYSVPMIILSPVFKLTPKFPLDQATFNELLNPAKIFGMEHEVNQKADVLVDKYNYIAPEFISLYVTVHTRAYLPFVPRILRLAGGSNETRQCFILF